MSRIEDVFKRITGAAPDPRPASALERYDAERTAKPEENRVTTFVAAGPHAVEPRPPIRRSTSSAEQAAPSPVTPPPHRQVGVPAGEDFLASNDKLVDVAKIFDYVGFLARSLRRHPFLALGTFAVVLGLTMSGAMLLPKTYYVSTKLLAQRNAVMTALSNPGRACTVGRRRSDSCRCRDCAPPRQLDCFNREDRPDAGVGAQARADPPPQGPHHAVGDRS